ncbi:MAG: pyridoxal phosphate-dependent aminotransferase family protein [Patescibacteria group bacterium]
MSERHVGPIQGMVRRLVRQITDMGFYPEVHQVDEIDGSRVLVGRQWLLSFAGNDYLGNLGRHGRVVEASVAALRKFGNGSRGSRLTAGTLEPHVQLERRIAAFKGDEDAIVFSTGFNANEGLLLALACVTLKSVRSLLSGNETPLPSLDIISDELIHASIADGVAVCSSRIFDRGAKLSRFKNNDMGELERVLGSSDSEHKIVMVDGVYSLHGRVAQLDTIIALARKYGAEVYVDDAHGVGVLGATGRGVAEMFGVCREVDFPIGTLSKALCGAGGYITGDRELIQYLRVAVRSYMYNTAMPACIAAGLVATFDVIEEEDWRRVRVNQSALRVRDELTRAGFDLLGSTTQIVPVGFRSSLNAAKAAAVLMDNGIYAPAYRPPAVPEVDSNVRVNITADHSDSDLDQVVSCLIKVGHDLAVI